MKAGDTVVCIRNPIKSHHLTKKNKEYTIKNIGENYKNDTILFFNEVPDGSRYLNGIYDYYGHDPARFRKLETYKSKVSCVKFKEIKEGLDSQVPQLV
jgi:hypothetical protein